MAITSTDYSKLRKAAEQRTKRLEAKGFSGYHAPKVKDLDPAALNREYRKLEKWMNKPSSTVPGARQEAERREAAKAEQRARHAAQQREYYRRKQEKKGKPVNTRPPKYTDEQRKEARRESQRRYRERQKDIHGNLDKLRHTNSTKFNALNNLLSGLKKWGIRVKSFKELEQWGDYIKERNVDSNKDFYEFDKWVDDLANNTPSGSEANATRHITAEDIYNTLLDFENWKSDQDSMDQELTRERSEGEYSSDEFGSMWDAYFHRND